MKFAAIFQARSPGFFVLTAMLTKSLSVQAAAFFTTATGTSQRNARFRWSNTFKAAASLAIASSTLAVAALFNPLRLRLLEAVDRRFNRARYDAQRVVDEFADGVRNEDETADLVEGLTSVVERTLQPRSVGVWIASDQ